MTKKNPSNTILPWLKENLGPKCLAPLTGTDTRALLAATLIVELWCYADADRQPALLLAFREVVLSMQPKCREFAYHAHAHVYNWETRRDFWLSAGLELDFTPRVCAFEPQGAAQ